MKLVKKIKIAGLGALGLLYLADYISEKKKPTSIWLYTSHPQLPFNWDKHLRLITNPFMKLFAGGIVSHHWDWTKIPDKKNYSKKWLKPQVDTFYKQFEGKKVGFFDHVRAHMSSGVQEVCILGLDKKKLKGGQKNYHYAFQIKGADTIYKSRIVIPKNEQVRILISNQPLRVLALDSQNNELPTIVKGPFSRQDKRFKNLRQF